LKACGLVTAAAAKRNPFVREISRSLSALCRKNTLFRRPRPILAVPPAQVIDQLLQAGRGRMVGAQVLLQPFAYGIADRSAGFTIDLSAVVGDSAIHDRIR
jgi:hypothetical protein